MAQKVYGPCSETQRKFLNHDAKFIIFGGGAMSGKSFLAQIYSLDYIDDPGFRAVYIRQTSTQLRQSGGLWDVAHGIYGEFGARFREDNMTATFPSGAVIQHKTCNADRETKNFDGGQYSLVVFDECQWHSENQVMYLFSRIRSQARGPHRLVATCNPHPDSFLLKFVLWYLDENTGIPIPERSGVTRYFARYRGELVFGSSVEEIREKYSPELNPDTYTFIPANVYDNPVQLKRNPDYVRQLENMKRSEMERLLLGSWFAREEASKMFKREWVEFVDTANFNAKKRVRSWDLAGSVVSEVNKDPDYTCSVLMSKDPVSGIYTIEDAYRFRKLSGEVIDEIIKTAIRDGIDEVQVTIPMEIGAGKAWSQHVIRTLAEAGIPCKTVQISGHKSKVNKFKPFTSLAEAGCVKIVRAPWNDWYLNELEAFDGGRSGHDDAVDATSDATTTLARSNTLPNFVLDSSFTKSTVLSN